MEKLDKLLISAHFQDRVEETAQFLYRQGGVTIPESWIAAVKIELENDHWLITWDESYSCPILKLRG